MTAAVPEPCPALLRVADAPPLAPLPARTSDKIGALACVALLVMVLIHFSMFLAAPKLSAIQPLLVFSRYLLWPFIIAVVINSLATLSGQALFRSVAPVAAFLTVGVISALLSPTLINSLRLLVFWSLGLLAMANVGLRLHHERTIRTIFLTLAVMVTLSAVIAVSLPKIGLQADGRSATGYAWRGLFPGKNQLGEICVYALLFTIAVPRLQRFWRVTALLGGWIVLLQTNSQSSVILAIGQVAYWLTLPAFRRLPLPNWAKIGMWAGFLAALGAAVLVGKDVALALLGRDATLTGRSDIWRMWLARAWEHWLVGAGPGTFTSVDSPVTRDLALAFQTYGVINTPHNMYIAVFGEVGLLGLIAFVPPLLWFLLAAPFLHANREGQIVGAVALTMMLGGMGETREVFGVGLNMAILISAYAMAVSRKRAASAPVRSGHPAC